MIGDEERRRGGEEERRRGREEGRRGGGEEGRRRGGEEEGQHTNSAPSRMPSTIPATTAAQLRPPKSFGVEMNLFTSIALSLIISVCDSKLIQTTINNNNKSKQ